MLDFWSLPFEVCLKRTDEQIPNLEETAVHIAPGDWACEYRGDLICFRFRTENQKTSFFLIVG
jgi:hypothetical protein